LSGASALDREIWDEFHADWERLAVECEQLRQHLLHEHGLKTETPALSSMGGSARLLFKVYLTNPPSIKAA